MQVGHRSRTRLRHAVGPSSKKMLMIKIACDLEISRLSQPVCNIGPAFASLALVE